VALLASAVERLFSITSELVMTVADNPAYSCRSRKLIVEANRSRAQVLASTERKVAAHAKSRPLQIVRPTVNTVWDVNLEVLTIFTIRTDLFGGYHKKRSRTGCEVRLALILTP